MSYDWIAAGIGPEWMVYLHISIILLFIVYYLVLLLRESKEWRGRPRPKPLPPGIYSNDNTSEIGMPVVVFDATGQEIPAAIWCDTVTGEVLVLCQGEEDEGGDIKRELRRYPAPLAVYRLDDIEVMKNE